jgi:ribosomal protein L3
MLTTSKVKLGESQFHYDQGIGAPLISIDVTVLKVEKVCLDMLRKYRKWRTNSMEAISMPTRAHEKLKKELEKCRNQIGTFEKNYMEKIGG